ncbi:MAG: class I SAM-dependent methyltransferase [Candidatus Diapherotrites archaeon]
MAEIIKKTDERIIPENFETRNQYLLYLRHLFAYEFAKGMLRKGCAVLEIGCGEGYGTSALAGKAGMITGLDVDKKTIAHASEKYGSGKCVFEEYDGTKIPHSAGTFDAVVSFQTIEHVRDDVNLISEARRVLKKGGVLILTTPNKTHRIKSGQWPVNKFHVREYYPKEFENILKEKFSEVNVRGICGSPEVQKLEAERLRRKNAIESALNRVARKISSGDRGFLGKYGLNDYHVIKGNIGDSLDLLAVCKK